MDWMTAFLLTLCIELSALLFLMREKDMPTVLAAGSLMNLASHTTLWFVLPSLLPLEHYLPVGEAIVLLMEASILKLFFRKDKIPMLLAISFMANSLSFLSGGIIDSYM